MLLLRVGHKSLWKVARTTLVLELENLSHVRLYFGAGAFNAEFICKAPHGIYYNTWGGLKYDRDI